MHEPTPSPKGIGKFIIEPSARELKSIRAGYRGGFCYEHDLPDTTRKAAQIATNIGAGSWTMFPILHDHSRRLLVEFYNWPGIGIYNFDRPFISYKKNFYWWYEAKLPGWWVDPQWKHASKEYEKPYDPR